MTRQSKPPADDFADRVRRREQQKLDPGRRDRKLWFGLGMFGVVGWSVALPTVAGALLGAWIDSRLPSRASWTLMLLGLGLAVGCASAWHWLQDERRSIVDTGKRGGNEPG